MPSDSLKSLMMAGCCGLLEVFFFFLEPSSRDDFIEAKRQETPVLIISSLFSDTSVEVLFRLGSFFSMRGEIN